MTRRSRKISLISIMFVCIMLVSSVGMWADAKSNINHSELIKKVEGLMAGVKANKKDFGMEHVDFNNLYLGDKLYSTMDATFYPICQGSKQVATITTMKNVNGSLVVQVEKYNGNTNILQGIKEKINLSDISLNRSISQKNLPINIVSQGSTQLCWAACTSSFGSYYKGTYHSPQTIADYMKIGANDGISSLTTVKTALGLMYNLGSTFKSTPLKYTEIKTNINLNKPIICDGRVMNGTTGHAVLVCGYVEDTASQIFVKFMDPMDSGSMRLATVDYQSDFSFHSVFNYTSEAYLY